MLPVVCTDWIFTTYHRLTEYSSRGAISGKGKVLAIIGPGTPMCIEFFGVAEVTYLRSPNTVRIVVSMITRESVMWWAVTLLSAEPTCTHQGGPLEPGTTSALPGHLLPVRTSSVQTSFLSPSPPCSLMFQIIVASRCA
jgi:hypothetical protein